jgi:hypothetical protein
MFKPLGLEKNKKKIAAMNKKKFVNTQKVIGVIQKNINFVR